MDLFDEFCADVEKEFNVTREQPGPEGKDYYTRAEVDEILARERAAMIKELSKEAIENGRKEEREADGNDSGSDEDPADLLRETED